MSELRAKADSPNGQRIDGTGIYVRAKLPQGGWGSVDILDLEPASLLAWLRSGGGNNPLAENTVGVLLGAGRIADEPEEPTEADILAALDFGKTAEQHL